MSSIPSCECICPNPPDSALSTSANIAGILTFAYAVFAGILAYLYLIKSFSKSSESVARFYDAFAACALESDLVRKDILASSSADLVLQEKFDTFSGLNGPDGTSTNPAHANGKGIADGLKAASAIPLPARTESSRTMSSRAGPPTPARAPQHRDPNFHPVPRPYDYNQPAPSPNPSSWPYILDPDSLARLYSHVRTAEIDLQRAAAKVIEQDADDQELSAWERLIGKGKWVNRANELQAGLEKREALTPRLLVVQMSLAGNRMRAQAEALRELERRVGWQEEEIERLREREREGGIGTGLTTRINTGEVMEV